MQHALQGRAAVRSHNYHQVFSLYRVTPNMGSFILDMMLDSLRLHKLVECEQCDEHVIHVLLGNCILSTFESLECEQYSRYA